VARSPWFCGRLVFAHLFKAVGVSVNAGGNESGAIFNTVTWEGHLPTSTSSMSNAKPVNHGGTRYPSAARFVDKLLDLAVKVTGTLNLALAGRTCPHALEKSYSFSILSSPLTGSFFVAFRLEEYSNPNCVLFDFPSNVWFTTRSPPPPEMPSVIHGLPSCCAHHQTPKLPAGSRKLSPLDRN